MQAGSGERNSIRVEAGLLRFDPGTRRSAELLPEALGEHVFEWFIRNKRAEWDNYRTQVTQFELDKYLNL